MTRDPVYAPRVNRASSRIGEGLKPLRMSAAGMDVRNVEAMSQPGETVLGVGKPAHIAGFTTASGFAAR